MVGILLLLATVLLQFPMFPINIGAERQPPEIEAATSVTVTNVNL